MTEKMRKFPRRQWGLSAASNPTVALILLVMLLPKTKSPSPGRVAVILNGMPASMPMVKSYRKQIVTQPYKSSKMALAVPQFLP